MNINDLKQELTNLKASYDHNLSILRDRIDGAEKSLKSDRVSSHDAFNMSATCQNLAVLAGKIEQTANVLRWMEAK